MKLNVKYSYPYNPNYKYTARLKRVDLNKKMEESIVNNKGFIITKHQGTTKDIKEPDSIYSYKFGKTLQDDNPYEDRHRCKCGHLKSRVYVGITCEICGEKVKYVDDDFEFFGWIRLKDEYPIIHPNLFKALQAFIGENNFMNILKNEDKKDENGYSIKYDKPKDEPFFGLGMLELPNKIDEILSYYKKKFPNKINYYDSIMESRNKIFINNVPVFTTLLRPFSVDSKDFNFEGTNRLYNMMCKYATEINRDDIKILKHSKTKNQLMFEMQMKYMELYEEIEAICSGKRGTFRNAFGGRYDFTSRSVIVANPKLRTDEVTLSYFTLCQLLEQTIINILHKSYNISYSDAHNIWEKASIKKDPRIYNIIENLIKDKPRGLPVLINRNPTIAFGGILQMFVVGINDSYTMGVPLQILPLLAADFDGDVLNILYIVNKNFFEIAHKIINPRNSMYISKNDGRLNDDMNHRKDLMINANTLMHIGRENYSSDQINNILQLKRKYSEVI